MTMEIYSSISYGNVYMYTGTFSDKLINASFADAVASEMFLHVWFSVMPLNSGCTFR